MPPITFEQLQAYADAIYEVRIDDAWVDANSVPGADVAALATAMISACNPYSLALCASENDRRCEQLRAAIDAGGWRWWPARGRCAAFRWVEASLLVEAPLDQIDHWARTWQQHAVWLPQAASTTARLRIYSPFSGAVKPRRLANMGLEWVGCDPPSPG